MSIFFPESLNEAGLNAGGVLDFVDDDGVEVKGEVAVLNELKCFALEVIEVEFVVGGFELFIVLVERGYIAGKAKGKRALLLILNACLGLLDEVSQFNGGAFGATVDFEALCLNAGDELFGGGGLFEEFAELRLYFFLGGGEGGELIK